MVLMIQMQLRESASQDGIMDGYKDQLGDNGDQVVADWIWEQAQKAWVQE